VNLAHPAVRKQIRWQEASHTSTEEAWLASTRPDGRLRVTASLKLLICDDVADIRLLMRAAFSTEPGFEVVGEAPDGEQAISYARELRPDVVVLDINMPGRNGLEILPELRRTVPDAAIVMFSGFEEWSRGGQARANGADAYIEKGTDVDEILESVRTAVARRRPASAL